MLHPVVQKEFNQPLLGGGKENLNQLLPPLPPRKPVLRVVVLDENRPLVPPPQLSPSIRNAKSNSAFAFRESIPIKGELVAMRGLDQSIRVVVAVQKSSCKPSKVSRRRKTTVRFNDQPQFFSLPMDEASVNARRSSIPAGSGLFRRRRFRYGCRGKLSTTEEGENDPLKSDGAWKSMLQFFFATCMVSEM
jgi:hypothetical protein